jgi:hypothetical protein
MRCRHTVPDWHRHVAPDAEHAAIYAACRLLIREGEPAADARTIACGYWGRQEACPLYEGPRTAGRPAPGAPRPAAADTPVTEAPWPVRGPGEPDPGTLLLIALAVTSIVLLAAVVAGVRGTWLVLAAGLSLATHVLCALRMWAGR